MRVQRDGEDPLTPSPSGDRGNLNFDDDDDLVLDLGTISFGIFHFFFSRDWLKDWRLGKYSLCASFPPSASLSHFCPGLSKRNVHSGREGFPEVVFLARVVTLVGVWYEGDGFCVRQAYLPLSGVPRCRFFG